MEEDDGTQQGVREPPWTDRAREVVARAARQAVRRGEVTVRPEHVLIELSRTAGAATTVLAALGADAERLAARLEATLPPVVAADVLAGPYPHAPELDAALTLAVSESRRLGHEYLGTEHLLLGLLSLPGGPAAEELARAGVTLSGGRAEVERVFGRPGRRLRQEEEKQEPPGPGHGPSPGGGPGAPAQAAAITAFPIEVDARSPRPVFEQIVERVKEGVATHRLRPGDRLASIRRLAQELGVAPGTVARAYALLERAGVVVTERARGTRVAPHRATIPRPVVDPAALVALLRPAAIAAFHLGATAAQLEDALHNAMREIFPPPAPGSRGGRAPDED